MEPSFAERLTSWLKFVDMRPATLARALGVSRPAVHGWMHGSSSPTTDRIVPIVKALGILGGVAEFFARMPTEEANTPLPDEPIGPHPGTGDVTRELDAAAFDRMFSADETCPTCGHSGEAA